MHFELRSTLQMLLASEMTQDAKVECLRALAATVGYEDLKLVMDMTCTSDKKLAILGVMSTSEQ